MRSLKKNREKSRNFPYTLFTGYIILLLIIGQPPWSMNAKKGEKRCSKLSKARNRNKEEEEAQTENSKIRM